MANDKIVLFQGKKNNNKENKNKKTPLFLQPLNKHF